MKGLKTSIADDIHEQLTDGDTDTYYNELWQEIKCHHQIENGLSEDASCREADVQLKAILLEIIRMYQLKLKDYREV